MSDVKKSFKETVKACIAEVKQEQKQKEQLKEALRKYVKSVLKEVIAGPDAVEQPEDDEKKINKQYDKDGNQPAKETQDQQVQQLTKLVHGINPDFNVYRETDGVTGAYTSGKRNFIVIDAGELFTVRINERWENNFDVTAMIRLQDRVKAIGLSWQQVKDFVKANFSDVAKSYVTKSKDKAIDNGEDKVPARDSDLADTSVPAKQAPLKPAEDGDGEAEDMVKDKEDEPSAQMKQVTEPREDPETKNKADDNKTTPKVDPPKHDNDKELVKKMPGKKRDKKGD